MSVELENLNAVFINEGISQSERLEKLNAIDFSQMKVLTEDHKSSARFEDLMIQKSHSED